MIPVPQAVIDVGTVMIEFLNARFTKHAMEGLIRFDD
jgi:hypothetical protein